MQPGLPRILSVNAGFMDTAAYLALKGLFTAHVTGNFVTLGAALVLGTSGALAKVLALPVFCIVVLLARFSSHGRSEEHTSELQSPCNLVCRLLLEKKKKNNTRLSAHNLSLVNTSYLSRINTSGQ